MVPAPTRDHPDIFIGRKELLQRLSHLYRSNRHALLQGLPGVGKSALIAEFARSHPILFSPACGHLGDLIGGLEPTIGLKRDDLKMAARVHRLAAQLPQFERPVVVDNVAHVPPRVAHLLSFIMIRQPVWLIARSTQPPELGHIWPYFFLFTQVDVPPFSAAETRDLLSIAAFPGDRAELLGAGPRLHRLAAGYPGMLAAFLAELRCRAYDLDSSEGLRLLALHARITAVSAAIN
jgi:hypothetical protein